MCVVLVSVTGESCKTSVAFNCINLIPFISEWKKIDIGYRSRDPVYPEYTIIRAITEKAHYPSSINVYVTLYLDSYPFLNYFSITEEFL